jgi:hypothetical protein
MIASSYELALTWADLVANRRWVRLILFQDFAAVWTRISAEEHAQFGPAVRAALLKHILSFAFF